MRNAAPLGLILLMVLLTGCARFAPPPGVKPIQRTMVVTAYCSCRSCCEWERDWLFRPVISKGPNKGRPKEVGITASGTRAMFGTVAADTSLYPFGTIVYVKGYGYGRVEDRGGAIKGDRLDLYFPTHPKALEWGRRTIQVSVWMPPAKKK
jgi:3D (Asp-Asp-Asp) domain-containing protein